MKLLCKFLFLLFPLLIFSQKPTYPAPMIAVDSLYREDQFYFGATYNSLYNTPEGVSQNKFSSGFTGGFLRDMPINKKRTLAIAPGIGLSYNKIFQNLLITETDGVYTYAAIPSDVNYTKDKLEQMSIDIPIELRWRNSTPESTKFWRIYTGFKFSYLLYNKYVYEYNGTRTVIYNNPDINDIQLGAYLTVGYNTWNFYTFYGFTPIFGDSAQINGEPVGFNILSLGLMFYIL